MNKFFMIVYMNLYLSNKLLKTIKSLFVSDQINHQYTRSIKKIGHYCDHIDWNTANLC